MACSPRIDLDGLRSCCLYPLCVSARLDITFDHTNAQSSTESRNRPLQQGRFASAWRTHDVDRANAACCQRLLDILSNSFVGRQNVLSNGYFGHSYSSLSSLFTWPQSPFQESEV